MSPKSTWTVLVSTRHSWNILASSILCILTSGTIYWFPALGQSLKSHLNLSENEVTWVLSAASGGSIFGFIGGIIYKRTGSKRTTIIGAACTSLPYLALALLIRYQARNTFFLVVLLALCIVTASYTVYSATMATTAAVFPKAQRGRIMGFLTAIYGMSAGVCGVLQAAFFPRIEHTERLLYFIACFTATPIAVAGFLFPDSTTASATETDPERAPLLPAANASPASARGSAPNTMEHPGTEGGLMALAYAIAVAIVVDLQFGAYASWTNSIRIPLPAVLADWAVRMGLPPILRAEVVSAIFVVLLLCSLLLLPFGFRASTIPQHNYTSVGGEEETVGPAGLPFRAVVRDMRFHLMAVTFFVLPGGATVTTLVRMGDVAASRMFPSFHNTAVPAEFATADAIGGAVQALIVAFSACNMMARLVAGSVADVGGSAKERESWKLRLIQGDVALMGVAILGLAFSSSWKLILAVGLVGYAHGTFFAIAPTQVSNWFGVDGFPLNFAVVGIGVLLATIGVSSWMATTVADYFMQGSWIDVAASASNNAKQRFCSGVWCYAPTFFLIAVLNCGLAVVYGMLHKRIVAAAVSPHVGRS